QRVDDLLAGGAGAGRGEQAACLFDVGGGKLDALDLPVETLTLGRVPVFGPQRFQSGHCIGHPLQEFTNRVLVGGGGRLGALGDVVHALPVQDRAVLGDGQTGRRRGGRLGAALGRRQLCRADDVVP